MVCMRKSYSGAAILPGVNGCMMVFFIRHTKLAEKRSYFKNFNHFNCFIILRIPRDLCRPGLQRLLSNWKTILVWCFCQALFILLAYRDLSGRRVKRLQCGAGMLPKAALNNFLVYCLSLINAACYNKQKVSQ